MNDHRIRLNLWTGPVIALLAGLCSCDTAPRQGHALSTAERPETADTGRLVATEGEPINLFGDLPGRENTEYWTRSQPALRQHTFAEEGDDADPDIDPQSGVIVFSSTRHNPNPDLYIKDTEGVAVTQLTADPASDVQPAFSPDGRRVAFASDRSGQWDIYVVNTDGTGTVQVTSGPADDIHPSWSPDGRQIVFCRLPHGKGQWELWITDASEGGVQRWIGYGLFPEWSPTEDTIVFQRARHRGSRWFSIWTLTLVDGEPRYPTEIVSSARAALILPTFNPDGGEIAYTSIGTAADRSRTMPAEISTDGVPSPRTPLETDMMSDIWIVETNGRLNRRLTDGHSSNRAPVFGLDGRVYFVSDVSGHGNVYSLPVTELETTDDGDRLTHRDVPGRTNAVPGQTNTRMVIESSTSSGRVEPSGVRSD